MPRLEEVFTQSGVPTVTYVQPDLYDEILVSVRTPGRCLVLEGPSGIGKTTTISKVLSSLAAKALFLSARKKSDLEIISSLPDMKEIGIVVVDDFHKLPDSLKQSLSDYMKTWPAAGFVDTSLS